MSDHKETPVADFVVNPFKAIGKDAMLIAASRDGKTNAMTAAWGGLGVMWSKNVSFIVIRPQRLTREFVDAADTYSLNFFGGERRDVLNYFGTVSGRDEDKISTSGLTLAESAATPYFTEASTVMVCRKLYRQAYQPECFVDPEPDRTWYPDRDHHFMYIGEIVKILAR